MNTLGMSITNSHLDNPDIESQIVWFANEGFESFFLSCGVTQSFEKIPVWANLSQKNGIRFEAVHAPSGYVNTMWCSGEDHLLYMNQITYLIDKCSEACVGKLILHTSVGEEYAVCDIGLERFLTLEAYAKKSGVHLCYENSDSLVHLTELLKNCDSFHGFCWDTGHNLCYTPKINLGELFAGKIMYTHLHDNDGVSDLHLLPFDGRNDWDKFAKTLKNSGYNGTLNLELSCRGKEEYNKISYKDFIKQSYSRAEKLQQLIENS